MILATFLEESRIDKAPGRSAENLFVPKHPKEDVLLTTVLGPLRRHGAHAPHRHRRPRRHRRFRRHRRPRRHRIPRRCNASIRRHRGGSLQPAAPRPLLAAAAVAATAVGGGHDHCQPPLAAGAPSARCGDRLLVGDCKRLRRVPSPPLRFALCFARSAFSGSALHEVFGCTTATHDHYCGLMPRPWLCGGFLSRPLITYDRVDTGVIVLGSYNFGLRVVPEDVRQIDILQALQGGPGNGADGEGREEHNGAGREELSGRECDLVFWREGKAARRDEATASTAAADGTADGGDVAPAYRAGDARGSGYDGVHRDRAAAAATAADALPSASRASSSSGSPVAPDTTKATVSPASHRLLHLALAGSPGATAPPSFCS